jgi:two-component system sensor histidine kinase KdpD
MLLLLVVGLVAATAGVAPALAAAVLAFMLGDFLFVRPYLTFTVASQDELIRLAVFMVVAIGLGLLTGGARRRELSALRSEREASALNAISARLVSEASTPAAASHVAEELERQLPGAAVSVWLPDADGSLEPQPKAGRAARAPVPEERDYARWVARESRANGLAPAEIGSSPAGGWPASGERSQATPKPTRADLFLPLQTATGFEGVLQVTPRRGQQLSNRDLLLVVSVSNLLAASLSSARLAAEASEARVAEEAERLKSAVVSSVSHELKTPLAAITAAVTDLADPHVEWDAQRARARLAGLTGDLERLDSAIVDLLDLSRLEAGSWSSAPADYPIGEIMGEVVTRVAPHVRSRIEIELDADPAVHADFMQVARALFIVVENALTYSTGPVSLGAAAGEDTVEIWVRDRGPGVGSHEIDRIFDKFYRGDSGRASSSSTGLGLAIARELLVANGGTIRVDAPEGGGARFVIELPTNEGTDA